jgi:hypothetical protein
LGNWKYPDEFEFYHLCHLPEPSPEKSAYRHVGFEVAFFELCDPRFGSMFESMVVFAIYVWLVFFVGSFLLGLIVLAVIPAFRLTLANLVVFTMGALPGISIFLFLVQPLLISSAKKTGTQLSMTAFSIELFFGALIGGTITVFIRMLFLNELRKVELRKKAALRR